MSLMSSSKWPIRLDQLSGSWNVLLTMARPTNHGNISPILQGNAIVFS